MAVSSFPYGVFVPAADSDTVTLNNMSANEEEIGGGGANAGCRCYNVAGSATRKGEGWYHLDGSLTFSHDIVIPADNIDDYQMKWESLSGSDPNDNTVAKSTWHPLSTSTFEVAWDLPGEGSLGGDVTVSIRKGTGSVLDTATWGGDISSEPEEKDK